MADGVMDHFYNQDKDETYEIVDAQARSDISDLEGDVSALDSGKVDKVTGKGLSTNDYTDAEQGKLGRIEDGAQLNNVFVFKATSVMLDPDNSTIICYILQGSLPRDNNYGLNDRDMVIVDFNGVDATQLPLTSLNMVKFYILGTPTSEVSIYHDVKFRADDGILYSSGMLNYWKPNSIRTFLYKYPVGGTYQGLLLQMPMADLTHYGEVRLSNSLSDAIETTAATSYAVKRLKDMIDAIAGGSFSYEIVQTLPAQGSISTTTMYLVPKQTAGTQNVYDEYINPTGLTADWEKIGDTEIDLSNYYTKTETDTLLDDKADTADLATVATSGDYDDLTNKPTIPAAQVNADWNASSGVAQILNKPTLAQVATSGDYDDLTNKPTIPTNTWRPIELNDVQIASSNPVKPLNIIAGDAISITHATGQQDENITISSFQPDYYGYNDSFTDVTGLASGGTWQPLASFSRANGIWLLSVAIQYPSNSTGYRGIGLNVSGSTNPTDVTGIRYQQTVQAANGAATNLVLTIPVTLSTPRTIYIMGRQNSGSAMGTAASPIRVRASWIRIAPLG